MILSECVTEEQALEQSKSIAERNIVECERQMLFDDCSDFSRLTGLAQDFPAIRERRVKARDLYAQVQKMDIDHLCFEVKNSSQGTLLSQSQGTTGNRLLGSTS
mmetsp:Transcript_25127/g.61966  ORF Transcript_25127/g.61966 Transcript_25127/m.61966 type:complete len:104 (-) Transcript_25127:970-1281(-)